MRLQARNEVTEEKNVVDGVNVGKPFDSLSKIWYKMQIYVSLF